MMPSPLARHAVPLGGAILLLVAPLLLLAPVLSDSISDAAGRLAARSGQLENARSLLAQRQEIERRAASLERDLDTESLFHRGADLVTAQTAVQSKVRAIVQAAGGIVRVLDAKSENSGGSRYRLTIKLSADGGAASLNTAIDQLEAARPRLLLRDLRMHGGANGFGPALPNSPMSLELEIDAYVDITPP